MIGPLRRCRACTALEGTATYDRLSFSAFDHDQAIGRLVCYYLYNFVAKILVEAFLGYYLLVHDHHHPNPGTEPVDNLPTALLFADLYFSQKMENIRFQPLPGHILFLDKIMK